MSFLSKLLNCNQKTKEIKKTDIGVKIQSISGESAQSVLTEYENEYVRLGLTIDVTEDEKELVSVIASSILAGSESDIQFKVKFVRGIDTDKMNAIAAISAISAGDYPDSVFGLVSIREIVNQ